MHISLRIAILPQAFHHYSNALRGASHLLASHHGSQVPTHRKDSVNVKLFLIPFLSVSTLSCLAQTAAPSNFFSSWENRVRATLAHQPAWPIPVIAPSSQIVQLFRFDVVHQYAPARTSTWIYDNGKGLNLIPFAKTEIDINLPTYIQHNTPKTIDGAGDVNFAIKYRAFAGNEQHGNYSTAFQLAGSVPTGSYKNGTAVSTLTPTVLATKGFGHFALQSTLGAILPTSSTVTVGRTVTWNSTTQYRLGKIFYPELEANANFYHGGPNDGKNQTFLSPGLMVSKLKFRKDPKDRLALICGAGFQIATSTFHSYNHSVILTSRFAF
jgi:hypothetical protein